MIMMMIALYNDDDDAANNDDSARHKQATISLQTNTQQLCLQARTRIFPGKQLDSVQQRPEEASVEPRHVHASIANPTRNIILDTR
jgi:hypothetical protein